MGGQGGAPPPGVQISGAPPWRKKTPPPSPTGQVDPPSKNGFFPSVKDQMPRKSITALLVLKKWFFKQFFEKISAGAKLFLVSVCILSVYFSESKTSPYKTLAPRGAFVFVNKALESMPRIFESYLPNTYIQSLPLCHKMCVRAKLFRQLGH